MVAAAFAAAGARGGAVTACFVPSIHLSAPAKAYRQLWADRWPSWHPSFGGGEVPLGATQLRVDAYPIFRSILSAEEELEASAELHLEVVTRLAGAGPVVAITYDFEIVEGELRDVTRDNMVGLDRDYWLSTTDPDDDTPWLTVPNAHRTVLAVEDPLLRVLVAEAAIGHGSIAFTAPDLTWIAQPHEETMTVASYDPSHLKVLSAAQRDVQTRWGTDQPSRPIINLAAVRDHFDAHRQQWSRQGVQVVTGPQYRTYDSGVLDVADEFPDNPSTADKEGEWDDPHGDSLRRWRRHAGALDLGGVLTTMDRLVAAITPTPDGWYPGLPATPVTHPV